MVLVTPDTYTEAGRFLHAVFPSLDPPTRQRIEQVILRLPESDLLSGGRTLPPGEDERSAARLPVA